MVDIKTTVKAMCAAIGGQQVMAERLGMGYQVFRNHLDQKCGSRFFTLVELEQMEDLSGTCLLAEHAASRKGKLLVDIPLLDALDNVELYHLSTQADAARGELAAAQIAVTGGDIRYSEGKRLWGLFRKSLRYQVHGFLAFLVLNGVPFADDGGLMSANSMVVPPTCRSGAPFAKTLCVEN